MCEFISWIEKKGKVYFLTDEQVYNSPTGEVLNKWSQNIEEDKKGHGAIRFYFNLEGGKERECTDFSKPDNFPIEIVIAIKNGQFQSFGRPEGLLSQPKWDAIDKEYHARRDAIHKEYQPKWDAIHKEYHAKRDAIHKKYQAKWDAIDIEYHVKFWQAFAIKRNRAEAWK